MKRKGLLFLVLAVLSVSLASAFDLAYGSQRVIDTVRDAISPFFGIFLGGPAQEYLFESVLFFFIILSFVYVVLNRISIFKKNQAVVWIITFAVTLLALRFTINIAWVKFVLLPYNILGVSLLAIIPFIIYLFFIEGFDSGAVRKFGWALYIFVYIGVWYTQFDDIGDIAYIYLFSSILGLIMILFDKSIRGWMARRLVQQGLDENVARRIAQLQREIREDTIRLSEVSGHYRDVLQDSIDRKIKELKRVSKGLRI